MIPRVRHVLSVFLLLAAPGLASAQSVRDSLHAAAQAAPLDSLVREVWPALSQFCATKNSPGYVRRACPIFVRQVLTLQRAESLLIVATSPPPVPPPVDTATYVATPPELPRAVPASRDPYPGKACTVTVPLAADIGAVVSAASGGAVVCLQGGASYPPARLTACPDTGWIVLRTAGTLPAEGMRMRPSLATALAKLVAPTNATQALVIAPGACRLYIRGVEATTAAAVTLTYGLVEIGGLNDTQTSATQQPRDIIAAQLSVHGQPTQQLQRCIALNARTVAIVDSWIADCHGSGYDAQAIGGWNGTGPYLIANNELQGSGENVLFGGAPPAAEGMVASDVTIVRNHIYTPLSWQGVWTKKLLLEVKVAHRVLIEGNVFDGSWTDGQTGYGIWIKSSCDAPYHYENTEDVTVRNNRMVHTGSGIAITGRENYEHPDYIALYPTERTQRIRVENNWVDSINVAPYVGDGRPTLIGSVTHGLADIAFVRNTIVTTGAVNAGIVFTGSPQPPVDRFDAQRNVLMEGAYSIFGDGGAIGTAALDAFTVPYTFTNNVLVAGPNGPYPYPAGTLTATSIAAALATGEGADTAAVNRATAGVVTPP